MFGNWLKTAVLMAAMIIHGAQPGPMLMVNQPQSASNSGNLWNGMRQTFSLGCGSWGGNGTNNNSLTPVTVSGISTATAIAAFVAVWGISKSWRTEHIARRAVLLMALMPSSLFLWAFYSEGLFIALGAGAVWADRRGKRWVAALCFAGIATTRMPGASATDRFRKRLIQV